MLVELIRALLAAALVALLPGWFWSRVLLANSSSSDLYERLTYSMALSMALVPAVALIPTRLLGMGLTLSVALVCVGFVFFGGLGVYLMVGSTNKGATTEEVLLAPPGRMLGMFTLGLLAVAFGMGLGVLAGVVPGVPIRPPVTVGLAPSTGVMFAIALLVFFAGLVYLVESRPEPAPLPRERSTEPRRPSVVLAQRLLLPGVLVLALLRGYLGPVLHDWPFIRGVDHYSHAVMAQLMMSQGEIDPYLIYPPGFHTLTAMISRLTSLQALQIFPLLSPLLLVLPALALYTLARRLWGWHYGVVAALFSVLLGGIYYYYNDAMYPNLVAAQFLMVVAISALIGLYAQPSMRSGVLFALVGSSVVLYHQISSLYLAALLALVGVLFVPYVLLRDRSRGVVVLWSLVLVGMLSVVYVWETYDLPGAVGALVGGSSGSSATGAAVDMAIGTQYPYPVVELVGNTVSQPVVWLGLLGMLLAASQLRSGACLPRKLAYFTLLLWVLLMAVGACTSLNGFPQRFGRDLGIPLAVFAAFGLLAVSRSLPASRKQFLAASLAVLLVTTLVGVRTVSSLQSAGSPSGRLTITPEIAAAGEWLREHNHGGNIMVSPQGTQVPSRMMLAMGGYSALQSFEVWQIERPRDLPPTGDEPPRDVLWTMNHPEGERTEEILEDYEISYIVLYKEMPDRPTQDYWKGFEGRSEFYRRVFENEDVLIVTRRERAPAD